MPYEMRQMSKEDAKQVWEWARQEGWNPGLYDWEIITDLDPKGCFAGILDEEMVSSIVAVHYQRRFGFIGMYIVTPKYRGRGYGLACGTDSGTYIAHMAEVEVDKKSGEVQVKRVVCAQDMGLVINPEGARLQVEGCITMGLGYALTEEIHFKGGEIHDRNFDTYEIPRFSWVPEIFNRLSSISILTFSGSIPAKGASIITLSLSS